MVDELNMRMEHWLNDPDMGKLKYSEENLFQGPFVHHKPHRK
jgi:hypothetical protein